MTPQEENFWKTVPGFLQILSHASFPCANCLYSFTVINHLLSLVSACEYYQTFTGPPIAKFSMSPMRLAVHVSSSSSLSE